MEEGPSTKDDSQGGASDPTSLPQQAEAPDPLQTKEDNAAFQPAEQREISRVKGCADGVHDYERVPPSKVLPAVVLAQVEGCQLSIRTPMDQSVRRSDLPETFVCRGCKKVLSRRKLCITVVVEGGDDVQPRTFSLKSECGKMCHICHKHFTQKIELAKHLIKEHDLTQLTKTLRRRDRKKVLPEEEVKKLEDAEVDEETVEVVCSRRGCHKTFSGRRAYLDHLAAVHRGETKVFECKECGKVFNHMGHLNKHKYIHTGECPFMCSHCGKRFNQKANLKAHLSTHMPKVNKKYLKVAMEGEDLPGSYICDHCGRTFFSLAGLQIHAKTHVTEKKTYACPHCPEVFDKFVDLKFHKQGHSGLKQWQCTECNKKCPSKSSWDEHMRIHTGERPHSCHLCGKSFKQKSTLAGHYRNIHGPNPKKVKDKPCPHCEEKFSSKSALQKHSKTCQVAVKQQLIIQVHA